MTKEQYEKWLQRFETEPRDTRDGEPSDASGFTDDVGIILID